MIIRITKNLIFLLILVSFLVATRAEASESTGLLSVKAGTQSLSSDVELARTSATQDTPKGTVIFGFENRLKPITWGIFFTQFSNKWETTLPDNQTDGEYTLTSLVVEVKKSTRLYKDLFFYGGGGLGISFLENRSDIDIGNSTTTRTDSFNLATFLGTLGLELRFDDMTTFIETQYYNVSGKASSTRYDHVEGLGGLRLMLGVGFFY